MRKETEHRRLRIVQGISRDRFKKEFSHVESEAYRSLVNDIDRQIMQLGLYRQQPKQIPDTCPMPISEI